MVVLASPLHAQNRRSPVERVEAEQGTGLPAELRFADLRLGPFYLQPRVGIRQLGWDSNVLGSPSPFEISDFRTTVSAGTRIAMPFRENHLITGDAQVDYLWFAETTELRTFNGAFDARYSYDTDRWNAELWTRYVDAQRGRLDVIEIGSEVVPPTYEVFGRVRQRDLDVGARAQWDLTERIYLSPRVQRRIIRYKDDPNSGTFLSESLDRTEEIVGGAIGYKLTTVTSFGIDGEYQLNDYEAPDNIRDATTHRVSGVVDIDDTAAFYGNALVGYRVLAPEEPWVIDFAGVAMDIAISLAPGGVAEITFLADRDAYPSFWFDSIYYLRQGGGIRALVQVQRDFALGVDLTVHEHKYPTEETVEQPDGTPLTARRFDRIYFGAGRLEWRQGGSRDVNFRLGYVRRESNFPIGNTEGLVVGGGVSLVY